MSEPFSQILLRWYAAEGRQLPWRSTRDPYLIWVSEIVLQQTRVSQGLDYYRRFVDRFPSVEHLARASEDEVLRMWQGLGYYSRARNMHAAAQRICEMGAFPGDYETIRSLPGIGDYTAAAIASFAFDAPYAVVDGNVYRVLSRYFAIETPMDSTVGRREYKALASEMLDKDNSAQYNQAIMDFGAIVCTPQHPSCSSCPLADSCLALAKGAVLSYPRKERAVRVRDRFFTYLLFSLEGRILLQRRPPGDIWQGLYQLPLIETDTPLSEDALAIRVGRPASRLIVTGKIHQLSHQRLHADCYEFDVLSAEEVKFEGIWVEESRLEDYAMPRLLLDILERR